MARLVLCMMLCSTIMTMTVRTRVRATVHHGQVQAVSQCLYPSHTLALLQGDKTVHALAREHIFAKPGHMHGPGQLDPERQNTARAAAYNNSRDPGDFYTLHERLLQEIARRAAVPGRAEPVSTAACDSHCRYLGLVRESKQSPCILCPCFTLCRHEFCAGSKCMHSVAIAARTMWRTGLRAAGHVVRRQQVWRAQLRAHAVAGWSVRRTQCSHQHQPPPRSGGTSLRRLPFRDCQTR